MLCEELLLRGKENFYIYNDLALSCFLKEEKKSAGNIGRTNRVSIYTTAQRLQWGAYHYQSRH